MPKSSKNPTEYNRRYSRRGKVISVFHRGTDSDSNPAIGALVEGKYVDGENFRLTSVGNENIIRKIDGNDTKYATSIGTDITNLGGTPANYIWVGTEFCNNHHIAIGASTEGSPDPSFIAVDGRVMLYSAAFPIIDDNPIQIDVNEGGEAGEIFLNDKLSKPLIFSVQDLIDEWNAGSPTTKYFTDFNINNHLVQAATSMDQPIFVNLVNMGGSGLPAGGYSYSLRYVDDDGNGTAWGPSTPIIPVVGNVSKQGVITTQIYKSYMKGINTHGQPPDPTSSTSYGIQLRLRINNEAGYAFTELRRVAHISGQGFEAVPAIEKITLSGVDVGVNSSTIIEFIDSSLNVWGAVDDFSEEETAAIDKVNAIKYYGNRFTMHGITYLTKVIDDTDLFLENEEGNIAHPYIADLDEIGFNDLQNQVYRKPYMHGERYGWALIGFDGNGGKAFAVPYKAGIMDGVDNFTNYKIPNRRESAAQDTIDFSQGLVTCADPGSRAASSFSKTHEVFDNSGEAFKDGGVGADTWYTNVIKNAAVSADYRPLSPSGALSSTKWKYNLQGPNLAPCIEARYTAALYHTANYRPQGWGHKIYSQGMKFRGIDQDQLPDHIKSFSIVRTKPAGRVLCQGIGFYDLEENTGNPVGKGLNEVLFYSPDIDQSIGHNPGLFDDIINNPGSYKVQLVSPVGFFSEAYSGIDDVGDGTMIDMISYAKILYEDDKFNYGDVSGAIGRGDGYVSFGRWRNISAGGATGVESDASEEFIFNIDGADQASLDGHEGRSKYLKLTISTAVGDTNLYKTAATTTGDEDFNDTKMKDWHEPMYIINIINDEAVVPLENITEYIDTGHHQKLNSLMGFSNGIDGQKFFLVDERPEDCFWLVDDVYNSFSRGAKTGADNQAVLTDSNANWVTDELVGFIIVNVTDGSSAVVTANTSNTVTGVLDDGTGDDWDANDVYYIVPKKYIYVNNKAWLLIPHLTKPEALDPLIAARYTEEYTACMSALGGAGVWDDGNRNVYGVAICYQEIDGNDAGRYLIEFNEVYLEAQYGGSHASSFFIPAENDKIELRYDNRMSLVVFGGDVSVGDALFVPVDSHVNQELAGKVSCYEMNIGFPYFNYRIGSFYQLSDNTPTIIAPGEYFDIEYVRQLAVLFTCESRVNLQLMYNDSFPKKYYVPRPAEVDETNLGSGATQMYEDHHFFEDYEDDYGDEYLDWNYGGFHFPGSSNIDYSKYLNDRRSYSKPIVGFSEKLSFLDRTIHSVKRNNPEEIDSLRVFPALNVFDGSDFAGDITFAWAANTARGDNLYKITARGICLMLTDKNILQDLTGGEIGIVGSSESFIQAEYWISKDIGINDEMWRSVAGFEDFLFFANSESVYLFNGSEKPSDIAKDAGYFNKVYNKGLRAIGSGFNSQVHGVIDRKHDEYWLSIKNTIAIASFFDGSAGYVGAVTSAPDYTLVNGQKVTILNGSTGNYDGEHTIIVAGTNTFVFLETWVATETADFISSVQFVFNYKLGAWSGRFRHNFDAYAYDKYNIYGAVNGLLLPVFELNTDDSSDVQNAYVIVAVVPEFGGRVEFKSVEVFSDIKPVSVEFAMTEDDLISNIGVPEAILDNATFGSYYLKNMGGSFKNKIPRKTSGGNRFQGQVLFVKISDTAEFTRTNIISVVTEYDKLKL